MRMPSRSPHRDARTIAIGSFQTIAATIISALGGRQSKDKAVFILIKVNGLCHSIRLQIWLTNLYQLI
jgi:hypothetical protein